MESRRKMTLLERHLENVDEFKYLGSQITSDGRSNRDLARKVNQANTAFNKKRNPLYLTTLTLNFDFEL